MKAIILAAGRGSRMGELTGEQPKCLTPFAGRPLLDWQMAALRATGAEKIGLVGGYRVEMLANRADRLFVNSRWERTNMVASLMCAAEWLRQEPCLVSYGDIFYSVEAVTALRTVSADIAITYDTDWLKLWSRRFADPLSDAETFRLDESGRLASIGQRPHGLDEIEGQYMGLLKFQPPGWEAVERLLQGLDISRLDMTALLNHLLAAGIGVETVPVQGGWGEVDSPSDLAVIEEMLREGSLRLPPLL